VTSRAEGVQQALLKLIEGTSPRCRHRRAQASTAGIPAGRHAQYSVRLRWRVLRLEKVIQQRSEKGGIGFGADIKSKSASKKVSEMLRTVEPEISSSLG